MGTHQRANMGKKPSKKELKKKDESSSDDDSSSSEEEQPKKKAKKASPKVAPKKKVESSSDDDSSSEEEEKPKKKASPKASPKAAKKKVSSSDDDSSDDDSSEEEKPKKKASPKAAAKKESSSDDDSDDDSSDDDSEEKKPAAKRAREEEPADEPAKKCKPDADGNEGPCPRVFVGGLSFDATEDSLREFFADCGEIIDMYMPMNDWGDKPKGHAFVTFDSDEGGAKACEKNEAEMMGRWLRINYAPKAASAAKSWGSTPYVPKEKPEGCTSCFVGNLSWNVDNDMLWAHFESIGSIGDARVATDRESGQSRGFGHVDFTDTDACTKAVETMNGTQMDNRDIRVDYAGGGGGKGDKGKGGKGKGKSDGKGKGKGKGKSDGKGKGKSKGKGKAPSRQSDGIQEFAGSKVSFGDDSD